MGRVLNATTVPRLKLAPAEPEVYPFTVRGQEFSFDTNSLLLTVPTPTDGVMPNGVPHKPVFPGPSRPQPGYLCLEACHACNMDCTYCFVQEYYPGVDMMTFKTAKDAINYFFPNRENVVRNPRTSIGFFGGEPLLNWKLIEQVTTYFEGFCSPRQPRFHITTNGVLINKKIAEFLKEHNYSLIVSLDGPEEIHNSCRKYKNGDGSFADVMRALEVLKAEGLSPSITLRATFTSATSDSLKERAQFLNEQRYKGYAGWVSIEPAFLTESRCIHPERVKESVDDKTVEKIEEEYLRVADWFVKEVEEGRRPVFHNLTKFIERILWSIQSASECGGGTGYFSVNAKGELFACHREQNSGIGNLHKGGVDVSLQAKWLDNRIYLRKNCEYCPIRYVCGGGCRERSVGEHDDIQLPVEVECKLKMVWFRTAAWIMSKLGPEKLKEIVPLPAQLRQKKKGVK